MITVDNLSKTYGERSVLHGVDLSFPGQKLSALIGPNGAGKTTLMMLLARLLAPSSGHVTIGGRAAQDLGIGDYARLVATLRQSPKVDLRLSVEELVAFGRFPYCRGELTARDRQAVDQAIDFLSLAPLRHAWLDELSGGQRQMAYLAMTIAQETDYVLLDEPLNNLDMKHAVQIMRALRRLCDERRRTVILVVHDINFAANYADHIVAMKDGRVHSAGPTAEVVTETNLQALYGLDMEILRGRNGYVCNYFTSSGETN